MRRFFFYGTLMAGSANPVARAIHARLRPLGRASVRGALFAIGEDGGWYPALVPGDGLAHGALYRPLPDFTADDLARMDAYEGSEYRRAPVPLQQGGQAEAYCWTAPLPETAVALPDGDFARWLRDTGRNAWGSQGPVNLRR